MKKQIMKKMLPKLRYLSGDPYPPQMDIYYKAAKNYSDAMDYYYYGYNPNERKDPGVDVQGNNKMPNLIVNNGQQTQQPHLELKNKVN